MEYKWLEWAKELQSIAQAGLTFCESDYDRDRYKKIRELSVEIIQEYTGIDHRKITDLFASETGYQTPKVDIRAAVIKDNKILLVKEKIDGRWSMPGGWADVNSSPSESAVRECSEEAGAKVLPKRIIAVHMANRHNKKELPYTIYKIIIECELKEMSFNGNTETLGAEFFDLNNLPPLSESRTSAGQIRLCFEAHKNDLFIPEFD
jgi:ADP-ribose pyrophosphatase YjhB (NUDIX family)